MNTPDTPSSNQNSVEPDQENSNAQDNAEKWYYLVGEKTCGPTTPKKIRDFIAEGALPATTYIAREGMSEWVRANSLPDFQSPGETVTLRVTGIPRADAAKTSPACTRQAPVFHRWDFIAVIVLAATIGTIGGAYILRRAYLVIQQKKRMEAARVIMEKRKAEVERTNRDLSRSQTEAYAAVRVNATPGFVNSLGMIFVPVPSTKVSFCIWATRVQDIYANPQMKESIDYLTNGLSYLRHPETNHYAWSVRWADAMDFCKWLTEKEQAEGWITTNQYYRLPTDVEWSSAIGLPPEQGDSPRTRQLNSKSTLYPWGDYWPPKAEDGNFFFDYDQQLARQGRAFEKALLDVVSNESAGTVAEQRQAILNRVPDFKDYVDGKPVGGYRPNRFGIYDLGTMEEWVVDWWDEPQAGPKTHVFRGVEGTHAPVSDLHKDRFLAANRGSDDDVNDQKFFRIVLATRQ